jgi:adenine deaminase
MTEPITTDELKTLIQAARGTRPCDIVLSGGLIVNVFTGELQRGDLGISSGRIVGVGAYKAAETIDVSGKYLSPGFIESHIHIESSGLVPSQLARGLVARGTTTVIADPHEIANVMGMPGIDAMHQDSLLTPIEFYFVLPSCVPATRLETSGASLSAEDLSALIDEEWVVGLGEVMNFPGVISSADDILKKIAMTHKRGKLIDGHAPLVSGKDLTAYLAAGIGSDHECTRPDEAAEKLSQGTFIMIREGGDAHNLDGLIGLVNEKNFWFMTLVGDDIGPGDLLRRGHIDYFLKRATARGVNPITAIRMATIVPAMRAGFSHLGALSPGRQADVVVLSDLTDFGVRMVFKKGKLVARDLHACFENSGNSDMPRVPMFVAGLDLKSLRVPFREGPARVIGLIPGQILTDEILLELKGENGAAVPDTDRDILKIAVIERHRGTGNVAVGFVRGFGLKAGAIGSSVGHDSHNITIVGTNDHDIIAAARRIIDLGGGQVVVRDGAAISELALPVAGLMSVLSLEEVDALMDKNLKAAGAIGCVLGNPFMTLSFLPLAVIPKLKITDRGLVDVEKFDFVPLYVS